MCGGISRPYGGCGGEGREALRGSALPGGRGSAAGQPFHKAPLLPPQPLIASLRGRILIYEANVLMIIKQ